MMRGRPGGATLNQPENILAGRNRDPLLRQRIVAFVMVCLFFAVQYVWWQDAWRYRFWFEPSPVFGPLYFLANKSPDDDWLGIVLLVILVPCILAVAVWPTRLTAILAVVAVL